MRRFSVGHFVDVDNQEPCGAVWRPLRATDPGGSFLRIEVAAEMGESVFQREAEVVAAVRAMRRSRE